MIKKLTLLALLIFTITFQSFADGPPIKDGSISVPYISLKLSEEQVEQAGIYRYIRLTKEQKSILKKSAQTDVPELLEIITAPFNDCSCGLIYWGLWSDKFEVQVPKRDLEYLQDDEVFGELVNTSNDFEELKESMYTRTLNIDINGDVFQNGVIVNNLHTALSKIELDKPSYGNGMYVFVNTPPLVTSEITKKAITTFKNTRQFFLSKKYDVYAYFAKEYIDNIDSGYNKLQVLHAEKSTIELTRIKNGCMVNCGSKWDIKASSTATWKGITYSENNLNDTLMASAWVESVPGHGIDESIRFTNFENPSTEKTKISGFIIANGFQKNKELFQKNSRLKSVVVSINGAPKYLVHLSDIMGYQTFSFPDISLSKADELTLRIVDIYGGVKFQDTAISMLVPYYRTQ